MYTTFLMLTHDIGARIYRIKEGCEKSYVPRSFAIIEHTYILNSPIVRGDIIPSLLNIWPIWGSKLAARCRTGWFILELQFMSPRFPNSKYIGKQII